MATTAIMQAPAEYQEPAPAPGQFTVPALPAPHQNGHASQQQAPVSDMNSEVPTYLARDALGHMHMMRSYPLLQPKPPPQRPVEVPHQTSFYDLPAELRIEIYKLALSNVSIQIGPLDSDRCAPHALTLTSRQTRHEVLPIIHGLCPVRGNVTDFNFWGMLAWIERIPPDDQRNLLKNGDLVIHLSTTEGKLVKDRENGSLRRWLHLRADQHRPQPDWKYQGPQLQKAAATEMRRRAKRMTEQGKREEFIKMLAALGVRM